jgi:hypothetical protein
LWWFYLIENKTEVKIFVRIDDGDVDDILNQNKKTILAGLNLLMLVMMLMMTAINKNYENKQNGKGEINNITTNKRDTKQ